MSDFKESRTRLVRHTFADLSDAFKAEIEWDYVEWQLEYGHTADVLYTLEDPETENDFPSDVHTLRYIASILRCNSMQDLATLLRNLRYEGPIPREDHLRGDPPLSPPGPRPLSPPTDQDYANVFGTPNRDITHRSDAFASRRTTPRQ